MRAQLSNRPSLSQLLTVSGPSAGRVLADAAGSCALAGCAGDTWLGDGLAGLSVLIHTHQQRDAVLALLELDGAARRVVLAPPGTQPDHLETVIDSAAVDAVVSDYPLAYAGLPRLTRSKRPAAPIHTATPPCDTEWVLFTSGTTGAPKLVAHSLAALTGVISQAPAVWSTMYDVRRYGGLQILLRALTGGGSMVLSDPDEPLAAFLTRAGEAGVTHISGTPSHWRRVLMSGHAGAINPAYVRLSGEIADQALLDRLRAAYPAARVAHAFASTEAGVAFDVTDGLAGFPAAWVDGDAPGAALRVSPGPAGDTLRIRSRRTATGYLGIGAPAMADADGFVDTGDIVARHGERFHFLGRAGGVINVGGQKVHPEEVEAVLNAHPAVIAARVQGRRNAIVGAVVAADVVVRQPPTGADAAALRHDILQTCRNQLTPFKVPALLQIVAALDMLPSGKLARPHA